MSCFGADGNRKGKGKGGDIVSGKEGLEALSEDEVKGDVSCE